MITVGINYSGGHDSSASISINGKVTFAIAEERITRKKQDASFPINSIKACLEYENIKPEQVDFYIVSWPKKWKYFLHDLFEILMGKRKANPFRVIFNMFRSLTTQSTSAIFHRAGLKIQPDKIIHIDHHLAHALSVLPYLKEDRALIFIIDGRGSSEATSVYIKQNTSLDLISRVNAPNSLGVFYAEITRLCGFKKYSDEWKVMGLAAYGDTILDLDKLLSFKGKEYKVNSKFLLTSDKIIIDSTNIDHKGSGEKDILENRGVVNFAYSAQLIYEQFLLNFFSTFCSEYKITSIGFAGGVALNCKANGFIKDKIRPNEFFIQPAASDDGTAIGAALYPFFKSNTLQLETFNPYLGNSYSDDEILKILENYKISANYIDEVEKDAAREISLGNIVGWFQGRDEFGPRALGNRSIIADPRIQDMNEKVNKIVKYRENWRPFAPSILEEYIDEILSGNSSRELYYMVISGLVKEKYKDQIPAVVHYDNSMRPQSVSKKLNPIYWSVINEFNRLTNIPVLLNTSFNIKGEPNVSSPTDAIKTFFSSGLDILYIGSFKIKK